MKDLLRSPVVRGIPAAIIFLTRIPIGGWPYSSEDFRWSSAYFPLVGALIGMATAVVFGLLIPVGYFPAAVLAIAFQMLLTGCFHEDGLADSADALGGGYTPEKVFEILKDSRVGSFGAAVLVVSIVGRAALLAELGRHGMFALVLVGCAARVGPVWLLVAQPYATPEGSRSRDVARAGPFHGLIASGWLVLILLILFLAGVPFGPAIIVSLLAILSTTTVLLGLYFRRRVGGVTGDFLGATEQVGELAAFAVLAYGFSNGL
jgi:adenosylcobinamide-GDP ribazoletransferase